MSLSVQGWQLNLLNFRWADERWVASILLTQDPVNSAPSGVGDIDYRSRQTDRDHDQADSDQDSCCVPSRRRSGPFLRALL